MLMKISKKCQYALRAVFELASRNHKVPVKTHDIARSQNISLRFTEVILNELKHGGFVESKRGNEGGYILKQSPDNLTIQQIIEYIEGPISISREDIKNEGNKTYFGENAFDELWKQANNALTDVFISKTFTDLVEYEGKHRNALPQNYSI
jgi:Rrf2 family cysteine metabolism transcriptional repressor